MRRFLGSRKCIDQALRVVHFEVDHSRKLTCIVRIVRIEALDNKLRMLMVLGEDNRLSKSVAASHFVAVRHQPFQNLVHGVFIEEPAIHGFRVHTIRYLAVFIPFDLVPARLLFLA